MCSSAQMPLLEKKFPTFTSYAEANLNDIYGEKLNESLQFKATKFESCVLMNKGSWDFELIDLPEEAQLSPVKDIISRDINSDGKIDLLLGGNLYGSEIETTRGDAGIGLLLIGDGVGNFESVNTLDSGFFIDKDVRRMNYIEGKKGYVIVVNNNDKVQLFRQISLWKQLR